MKKKKVSQDLTIILFSKSDFVKPRVIHSIYSNRETKQNRSTHFRA